MKKLIALATAALLSAAAFASENTIHLGAYVPISSLSTKDDLETDIFSVGGGAYFDYTHVGDSGFTFKLGTGFNVLTLGGSAELKSITIDSYEFKLDKTYDQYGDSFGWEIAELGFGASFIHNELMTLSLTGNVGLAVQDLSYDVGLLNSHYKCTVTPFLFYIGPEVSFTYRPVKHFGVSASVGAFYAVGSYSASIDMGGASKSTSGSISGFIFQPKLGAAITF